MRKMLLFELCQRFHTLSDVIIIEFNIKRNKTCTCMYDTTTENHCDSFAFVCDSLTFATILYFLYFVLSIFTENRFFFLQGRLFFSPRIIGFYSNIFGHKTKFFFLWEDVDDIQVIPPTLSIGNPSLMVILRKDRGSEAKHGAKGTDNHGRFKFHFQSFVSFNDAHRYLSFVCF